MLRTDGGSLNFWRDWLEDMKKKDEKENMEEMHQKKVEQMIKSAEGSAGLLHKIRKSTPWRGGAQILETEEEDARLLDRFEAKREEWSKHWQCNEEVQNMQDKPWSNEELRRCEEALPRLKEGDLEKTSRTYQTKTGVGSDGFHPKVPDLTKRNERRNCGILGEGGAEWQMAATSLHDDVLLFFLKTLRVRERLRCCRR